MNKKKINPHSQETLSVRIPDLGGGMQNKMQGNPPPPGLGVRGCLGPRADPLGGVVVT